MGGYVWGVGIINTTRRYKSIWRRNYITKFVVFQLCLMCFVLLIRPIWEFVRNIYFYGLVHPTPVLYDIKINLDSRDVDKWWTDEMIGFNHSKDSLFIERTTWNDIVTNINNTIKTHKSIRLVNELKKISMARSNW